MSYPVVVTVTTQDKEEPSLRRMSKGDGCPILDSCNPNVSFGKCEVGSGRKGG